MKVQRRSFVTAGFCACIAVLGMPAQASTPAVTGSIDPVTGFQSTSAPIDHQRFADGSGSLDLAVGTSAYSTTLTVNGESRRYLVIRPVATVANAPLLLLLHPNSTSPEVTANLTEISDYVLTQGFWAVLPKSKGNHWDDAPAKDGSDGVDLPFLSALIDSLIAQGGVDATRIYASGFSSGGFMTERLACDLSSKIAAFGIDAATMRGSQVAVCSPAKARPKVYFLGTRDFVVPYNGDFPDSPNGLGSAATSLNFWFRQQACTGVVSSVLPDRVSDGTHVQLDNYIGCAAGSALQLYTIDGGGHAWPGGDPSYVGKTTQNINASGLIWRFVSPYRR